MVDDLVAAIERFIEAKTAAERLRNPESMRALDKARIVLVEAFAGRRPSRDAA
jgi:hypothetical protein